MLWVNSYSYQLKLIYYYLPRPEDRPVLNHGRHTVPQPRSSAWPSESQQLSQSRTGPTFSKDNSQNSYFTDIYLKKISLLSLIIRRKFNLLCFDHGNFLSIYIPWYWKLFNFSKKLQLHTPIYDRSCDISYVQNVCAMFK